MIECEDLMEGAGQVINDTIGTWVVGIGKINEMGAKYGINLGIYY